MSNQWFVKPETKFSSAQVFTRSGAELVCEVYGDSREQRQQRASLIAAAPELLEQLEALAYQLEASRCLVPAGVAAVILKAKGRE